MAIKFQYNKTSLQVLEKQLKVRKRTLPIIKSKESVSGIVGYAVLAKVTVIIGIPALFIV